ncbi:phospholipase D-like domain-containing protein [Nocardioides sp. C4-1]|uniref:phospholipase D-like domain-containing protein n=1 Tax=Nocardioides sp. C4-1 TaxID=3151851 RepID=UPI0032645BCA
MTPGLSPHPAPRRALRRQTSARRRPTVAIALTLSLATSTLALLGASSGASGSSPADSTVTASQTTASTVAAAAPAVLKAAPQAKKKKKKKWAQWTPPTGAAFNLPRSSYAQEYRLEARVIDAINHARRGSMIRMAMFSFDRQPVADALIRAYKKRKVTVQVIINGHEKPGAQADLQRVLGPRWKKRKKNKSNSFYYQCTSSCRGDFDVQHSKFVLFSHTGAAKRVVMIGSLNMKENGAVNQFNDLLTINQPGGMYDSLEQTFKEMRADKVMKNSYKAETFGRYQLYTLPFPRAKATAKTQWLWRRDPIKKILGPITCRGPGGGRTVIRVDMHAWSDDRGVRIANRLRDLYAEGCDVKIMIGYANGVIQRVFGARTARGFVPVRSTGFDTPDSNGDYDGEIDLYSHAKILTINGIYEGKRNRRIIVTGSSNYQAGGQYGDELILKVDSARLYNQYLAHWNNTYRNHTHGFHFNGGTWKVQPDGRRSFAYDDTWGGLGIDSPEWRDE